MKDILKEYNKALLLHGHLSWQMRYIVSEMEKMAFSMGFYKAFGLGAGLANYAITVKPLHPVFIQLKPDRQWRRAVLTSIKRQEVIV